MADKSIKYNKLEPYLGSVPADDLPGLFLIYGEHYLIKKAFKTLTSFLIGNAANKFALEILEGGTVSMGGIIEQVSTFSFLGKKKIVAVKNIPLFQTQNSSQEINFSPSDHDHFIAFIQNGIPKNHFLVLTSSSIDKRKKIFKGIQDKGLIIDCAVAQGVRKADIDEQTAVLKSVAARILSQSKKRMDNHAFQELLDLTGFNLDLFSQNLSKLIAYAGKTEMISKNDVKAVIIKDRKDPIFNLTNAFIDKDVKKSLVYLNSLFNEGFHPLQILKSFENQVRKLILLKCFTQKFQQSNAMDLKKINFNGFKQMVLPKIISYDGQTKKNIEEQFVMMGPKKKSTNSNDLFLAPNPKNPYPVFLAIQKSENFSLNELNHALIFLSDLDFKLKSSSVDAKTQIENFIINTCCKGEDCS